MSDSKRLMLSCQTASRAVVVLREAILEQYPAESPDGETEPSDYTTFRRELLTALDVAFEAADQLDAVCR